MLKREEILKMFETAGAIRHGHFELSSGRHSGTYVQCALVLQYPRFAEKLGQALAELFSDVRVDEVVSPAIGGLIIGQEVARALPDPKTEMGAGVPAHANIRKQLRQGLPELFRKPRVLQHERALHIGSTVPSARQFEMPVADGAGGLEHLQDFFALEHGLS